MVTIPVVSEPVAAVVPEPVIAPTPEKPVVTIPVVTEPVAVVVPEPIVTPTPEKPVVSIPVVTEPVVVVLPEPVIAPTPEKPIFPIPAVTEPVAVVVPEPIVAPTPEKPVLPIPAVTEPVAVVVREPVVTLGPKEPTIPINCEPSFIIPIELADSTFNNNIEPPTPIKNDTITKMKFQIKQNCEQSNYLIKVSGCAVIQPEKYIDSIKITQQNELEIIVKADSNQIIQLTCIETKEKSDSIYLMKLQKPVIRILKDFDELICSETPISLRSVCTEKINFLNWEKDGHSFSTNETINGILESGNYQAVYQNNDCIYRSELMVIDRFPPIQKPIIKIPKNKICTREAIELTTSSSSKFYDWDGLSNTKNYNFQRAIGGNYPIQLRVSENGKCWSKWSDIQFVNVLNSPDKPQLIASLIEFAPNDSVQIKSKEEAMEYEWSNGESTQTFFTHKADTIQYKILNINGCWSNFSDPIVIKPYNSIKKPIELNGSEEEKNIEPIRPNLPEMNIFPNPSNGEVINITATENLLDAEVWIYDMRGELVLNKKITDARETIKLENLDVKSGIYFLKINTKNWNSIKRLMIVK